MDIVSEITGLAQEFKFDMATKERVAKCWEEDMELYVSFHVSDFDNLQKEAADRVITGILLLQSMGCNPVAAVVAKVDETRRKYRDQQG